jgi:hypothetical protein
MWWWDVQHAVSNEEHPDQRIMPLLLGVKCVLDLLLAHRIDVGIAADALDEPWAVSMPSVSVVTEEVPLVRERKRSRKVIEGSGFKETTRKRGRRKD